jgi:hypothetical protein
MSRHYDEVIETSEAFGSIWKLTVFAVLHCFPYLEACGSSLFCIVLHCFDNEKKKQRTQ